jgi:hypothetical protein
MFDFKKLIHFHRYKTLIIYPPHSARCDLPQCAKNNEYGFLMQCSCGHMKVTGLPCTITEIYHAESKK